ncbi:putative ABC transporter permease [Bifidobacterium sp.]|uniref:putative ABC transporter permease n=1 Tax=Bifidobacterium sp. TaxID=41200 RepID=UPI003D7E8001
MSETAQSEAQSEERSKDSVAGKAVTESKAIADETEIAAIEGADSPADRRLPLIVRIYGIVMIVEGVVTLPIIVLSCLYVVQAVLSGDMRVDALSLTTILSAIQSVVLMVTTACLTVFGVLLFRNKRRHIAQWTYLLIPLTLAEGLLSLALKGLGPNLISPAVQLVVLIALHITADPSLREERRLQFALRRMDARSAYENAASQGMAGRDLTGKGYISLDFFNLFWLFTIGCVFGLVVETIYHFILFGEYQDRAGFLWGPFSPIYGFGVVIVTVLLNHLWQSNWLLIFCSSAVIGGAFEYFTSWFMQVAFGIRAWDYTGQWLSIDGRTSGKYMFFWGVLGLVWVKLILPRLLRLIQRIPWRIRYSLTLVCFVFVFVDGVMTLMALDAWYSRMAGIAQDSPVAQFFATYFNDDFMAHRFQTMKIDPSTAGRM